MKLRAPTKFGILLVALASVVRVQAQTVEWISSAAAAPWVEQNKLALGTNREDAPYDLEVRLDQRRQAIDGWGGCFNELGWVALQTLPPETRNEVLKNIFAPGVGLNFTICRMPIGASDYSTNWYSLDDTPGDFELKHFSLERDRALLLPYIKAAMKYQPALKIWGSPWSPPAWLKVNQTYNSKDTNRMIQDAQHLATHAKYLAKYVQAYRAEGVDVFAVAVQNEPFASQVFPSCVWSPAELRDFIGTYVGPTFRREKLDTQIWLGTFNNNQFSAFDASLSDRRAAKFISAVGLQWAGKNAVAEINERYPKLKIIQTESECGDGSFDWQAAEYTFSLMKHYFNHGVNLYTYWNMALDDTGHSTWGWKQNALVKINRANATVTYTPEFYLFKHLSHFVPANSVKLASDGNFDDALAFQRPDGGVVLMLANRQAFKQNVDVKVGDKHLSARLPAKSFNTFHLTPPLRVLMLSGANNHDWRSTTPALQRMLEADGHFAVTVETNVPAMQPDAFNNYDAVLSNFNTFGLKNPGEVWNADMRASFVKFIRSGHGLVVVHAGSSVFYDWPEFQQIAGATWGKSTHHGKIHANKIHPLAPQHPVTAGLKDFPTSDEYWQDAQVAAGAIPLATVTPKPEFGGSGKPEPIAFVTEFGGGRGFALLLGHNTNAMESAGFKILLQRGTEWAATGKISPGNIPTEQSK